MDSAESATLLAVCLNWKNSAHGTGDREQTAVMRSGRNFPGRRSTIHLRLFSFPTERNAPGEFMQQRRLRLGDILDDYCPRERRITNHVVVALIEDDVKQTRCSTCDAEHEYKQAKVPSARRKKAGALFQEVLEDARPRAVTPPAPAHDALPDDSADETEPHVHGDAPEPEHHVDVQSAVADADLEEERDERPEDEGPVHRRLIRATLPRPEGHVPERKEPDFTIRQPGRESNGNRPGQRPRGHRPARSAQGQHGGQNRFGGQRQGAGAPRNGSGAPHGQGSGQRPQGNRPGQPAANRGGGQQNRGQGRKRGR